VQIGAELVAQEHYEAFQNAALGGGEGGGGQYAGELGCHCLRA
jgi:hypothetical protein